MDDITFSVWAFAFAAAFLGGFVKGVVGFAMPMVMISLIGSVLPPDQALAALIVPTVFSNLWQSLRNGPMAALNSARRHIRFIAMVMGFILLSAQAFAILPDDVLFIALGVPVVGFALAQLWGWRLQIAQRNRRRAELGIGALAGTIGGVSGVWGPPTVMYLTALETPKVEQMRVQGVVYGLGAVVLALAHIRSGVLNTDSALFSAALVIPAMIGLVLGFAAQDRMDQSLFKKATLIVLVLAGANLLRRGLLG